MCDWMQKWQPLKKEQNSFSPEVTSFIADGEQLSSDSPLHCTHLLSGLGSFQIPLHGRLDVTSLGELPEQGTWTGH